MSVNPDLFRFRKREDTIINVYVFKKYSSLYISMHTILVNE